MSGLEYLAVMLAGLVAGTVNTIVGAGTLITFPLLVAIGVPPLTANVSNSVGLVPGAVTGAWGFRRELAGRWATVARMGAASALGGIAGGLLLLRAPGAFGVVVPWLLVLAAALAAVQPRVADALRRREALAALARGQTLTEPPPVGLADAVTRPVGPVLALGILATGVYGGYFGAAQGVVLLALLGIAWSTDLHRANGAKVVLAGVANLVSAVVFTLSGEVDWAITGILAVGAAAGGVLGARLGRRIPAPVLRVVIVVAGLGAAVALWVRGA
ncbi:sulfite exporter TauE/SafE family protein [Actinotalea fermentans]|uniref:Probable membrane transporter protein n=1 Tax=Actinotalea fermentans TaxID=43671 RepID=A0A511YTD5_9CELL|nr:sulfite exporter TauE/SafE family protein [Actinotalea fermentans]GEN78461.1 UPF0721 transmembrane protein [Actinotalea fermentans]